MLEEMKAYAQQAIEIERQAITIKNLFSEIEHINKMCLKKEAVAKWLTIGDSYIFVNEEFKDEIRDIFLTEKEEEA
jgi:hypothetical protein